jgi:glutamyl-tRNA reductase
MSSINQTAEPARQIATKKESSAEGKTIHVGFVGLGHMGAGMAANLLKAGHHVTVFNRTSAKIERWSRAARKLP